MTQPSPFSSPWRRYFGLGALTICLLQGLAAQGYDTAVGLRVGRAGGLSIAQRVAKRVSAEAHLTTGLWESGTTLTLLGRQHLPLISRKLNLFVGAGFHQGFGYDVDDDREPLFGRRRANPFGLDGQVGLEVTFGRTNIAFDYLPQVNFGGRAAPLRLTSAITLRYVLNKRSPALQVNWPWAQTEKEFRQRDKVKRKRQKTRAKTRAERPTLRERLGLD